MSPTQLDSVADSADPRDVLAAVVGELCPTLRRCGRLRFDVGTSQRIAAPSYRVEEVLVLAILHGTSGLDALDANDRSVEIRVGERSDAVVFEVVVIGTTIVACASGAAACAARTASLGGELFIERAPDRCTVRLSLPRAPR
jgi:hypothetical protein